MMWRNRFWAGAAVACLLAGVPSLAAAQPNGSYGGYSAYDRWGASDQPYGCDDADCARACDQDDADCDAMRGDDDGYFACDVAGDDCDQVSRYDDRSYRDNDPRYGDSDRRDDDGDTDYDDD